MNISIHANKITVSKTFGDGNRYVAKGYTGGIPSNGTLLPGTCQGIIVYYKQDNSGGDPISWDINQYGTPGGTINPFLVTVFLVEDGTDIKIAEGKSGDVEYI